MPAASKQHLPKDYEPGSCVPVECPTCKSTATRFVYQHLCGDKKEPGHLGVVTLEVPAYNCEEDSKKKPYKWKCPVCTAKNKDKELNAVLIKCGECGRMTKI